MNRSTKAPHPWVWLVLYIPFGALGGFNTIALTFLATKHGLSITEGALIATSGLLINWLKWLWAPIVDITLSPKRWYVIGTIFSAIGVVAMAAVPLEKDTLWLLLLVIAGANLINTVTAMASEAMMAALTPEGHYGRAGAWSQAGNLGGNGLGGGLGLFLVTHLAHPWMSGLIMGILFLFCCLALLPLENVKAHVTGQRPLQAVKTVSVSLWQMLKTRVGFMTGFLCMLPVGTGAAQVTLTQAAVAAHWGAGADQVEFVQGLISGLFTAIGCFVGGWGCNKLVDPRKAYWIFGLVLAAIASAMAVSPTTIQMYVWFNMIYAFGVGLAYAAFTAMSLAALGGSAAATGYNVFASLSNFPIWWVGLLLGWVADHHGASVMLHTEAVLGVIGVLAFVAVGRFGEQKARAVAAA